MSALMNQYNAIKEKHPDALLLFRVNDFYESFGDDAIKIADITGLILTKNADEIPLTGFAFNSLDTYLPMLVRAGNRVAICEELHDMAYNGYVKR